MRDVIYFSVPGSAAIHELRLGLTLARFIGYDLHYFDEQCAETYRRGRGAMHDILERGRALKEYIRDCHPYCGALIKTEFDGVFLDCVISHICFEEGIGLEELWVRTMSSEGAFEKAVFARITDYKTGHAINQWSNLLRMQAYAAEKATFIYGGEEADAATHKARKLYFDMAFAMAAGGLGFQGGDLPQVRCSSVPFLQQAPEMLRNIAHSLGPVVGALAQKPGPRAPVRGRECVKDQIAGIVAKTIAGIRRPGDEEIRQIVQKYASLPETVYEPSSLKAVIDLEFDKLMEMGFYLRPEGQGSYQRLKYPGRRVPAAGKGGADAVQPPEEEREGLPGKEGVQGRRRRRPGAEGQGRGEQEAALAEKAAPAPDTPASGALAAAQAERGAKQAGQSEPTSAGLKAAPEQVAAAAEHGASGKVRKIIAMANDPGRKPSKSRTLQEINMRCNLIWTSMNFREGWDVTAEETSEWFRYLTKLRYGIGTGKLQPEELDKFLDATLEVFRLLPEEEK